MLTSVNAICGQVMMGLVLGLSRDIADSAISSFEAKYVNLRNRILTMLQYFDVSEYYQRYITGYIDANYLRCNNNNIKDTLKGHVVPPAVLSDLYYNLIGAQLKHIYVFEGMSDNSIREIASRASDLENYFSGHIIQNQGTQLDGILLVLTGSVILGKRGIAVAGDVIFAHHFQYDVPKVAETNVYAYTRSEIIKLNKNMLLEILEHYPDDKHLLLSNLEAAAGKSATNLVTRMDKKMIAKPDLMEESINNRRTSSVFNSMLTRNSVGPAIR
jgi:CRP-like cAMP-binding protein